MGQLLSWLPFGRTTKPGLASKDLEGVAQYIASGKCKNIVIMVRRVNCVLLRRDLIGYFCLKFRLEQVCIIQYFVPVSTES
jgi:hypothetical protein